MPGSESTSSSTITAILKAGARAEKIGITEISMAGCTALLPFNVTRQQSVTLQLFEDKGNGQFEPYTAISANVESVTPGKTRDNIAVEAKIKFNGPIAANHGVVQSLNKIKQQTYQHAETNLESKNSSLYIIPVNCHMCGQEHIPFRSLHRHTMAAQTNIFGIPQYTTALSGKQFCDYNLLRVAVCPTCYFASGYANDFVKESKSVKDHVEPFNKETIATQWSDNMSVRKQLIETKLDGFFNEERTLEQALLAYDLALTTNNAIMDTEQTKKERSRNYGIALKGVFYMMIKAELLMSNKKDKDAEAILKEALIRLDDIFPYLRRESSIKAGFLMGMLGLYFESSKIVVRSLTFLQQYKDKNKVKFGTDEQKTLGVSLKKMSDAYQSRSDFSRKNLKGFNKPFEF